MAADGRNRTKYGRSRKHPFAQRSTRPLTSHVTRHTWASHAVMNGTPLLVVAQNLGHRDTRMVERHYGHLAPGYRQDEIRKGAPTFGIKPKRGVTSLDDRRTRNSGR